MRGVVVFLISLSTFAGGVDVGNGITVEIVVDSQFTTEKSLVDYVEAETPLIERGQFGSLSKYIKKLSCDQKTKVKNVEVLEIYPFKDGMIGKKNYQGLIKIDLLNCKKKL